MLERIWEACLVSTLCWDTNISTSLLFQWHFILVLSGLPLYGHNCAYWLPQTLQGELHELFWHFSSNIHVSLLPYAIMNLFWSWRRSIYRYDHDSSIGTVLDCWLFIKHSQSSIESSEQSVVVIHWIFGMIQLSHYSQTIAKKLNIMYMISIATKCDIF